MKILKSGNLVVIAKLTISAAILFFIFRIIGLEKVYSELANANIFYVFVSFVFVFLAIFLKSLRWKNIAGLFNAHISIRESLKYTYISLAFGMITPGRVGEFIKAKYLNDKSNVGVMKSLITVTLDKLFDVVALMGFALIGLSFFDFGIPVPPTIFMILLVLYLVILLAFFFYPEKLVMAAKFFIPEKYKSKLNFFSEFNRSHLSSLCFSALIWIFFSFSAFFILKSLGISNTPLLVIIVAVPLMALSSLLPISLGGVGVREAVAISLFLAIGVAVEKSLVFSLIYTFNGFIVPAIIGTFIYLKIKR